MAFCSLPMPDAAVALPIAAAHCGEGSEALAKAPECFALAGSDMTFSVCVSPRESPSEVWESQTQTRCLRQPRRTHGMDGMPVASV